MQRNGATVAIALDATAKRLVPKKQLAGWTHDNSFHLANSGLVILKKWLGVRYNRAAFPNEFERRLTALGLREKIQKALKPANNIVSAIYFKLGTLDELSPADKAPYELTIVLLYQPGKNPDKAADQADHVAARIVMDFEECCYVEGSDTWQHLKLKDCLAISEEEATVALVKELQQWRLDQWSFKPEVDAAMPPSV